MRSQRWSGRGPGFAALAALATAILDRFLHYCEVISTNGANYRLKNFLKAIE
ncbi:ATP-binding protein [Streptomyces sparsogenes]|uniref:ATP-binding protein n=1 Tax=Streptomyces sparsogenes TaxID=67365 RepID=UPI003D9DF2D3